jgi:hypothetical protein
LWHDLVPVFEIGGKDPMKAGEIQARTGNQGRQARDDKSAGLPIWTTAGRPKGGAQGCAPSNPAVPESHASNHPGTAACSGTPTGHGHRQRGVWSLSGDE